MSAAAAKRDERDRLRHESGHQHDLDTTTAAPAMNADGLYEV